MSIDKSKATATVYSAIDELNKELGGGQQLEKSPSTVLSGEGSDLDSIAIVSLQMILEEKIGDAFGADVFIDFDELVDSAGTEPRTVADLIDRLLVILAQGAGAP